MANMASVKPAEPDPKLGKPKPKSSVHFPYVNLDRSIEVARKIIEQAGGRCDRTQLAAILDYSGVQNGGFLSRVAAAKMFGLIEESASGISVTERGRAIVSPVRESDGDSARVDAFLSVELFRRVFEEFSGQTLPQVAGLQNLLQNTYGVVPNQVGNALRVLLDSADTAGFFRVAKNRSRMIKPIIDAESASKVDSADQIPPAKEGRVADQKGGDAGLPPGGGGSDGVHPALLGLLKTLPAAGAKLGPKRRKALVDAFTSTINLIYPEEED